MARPKGKDCRQCFFLLSLDTQANLLKNRTSGDALISTFSSLRRNQCLLVAKHAHESTENAASKYIHLKYCTFDLAIQ
jgi:hypothetical protein